MKFEQNFIISLVRKVNKLVVMNKRIKSVLQRSWEKGE